MEQEVKRGLAPALQFPVPLSGKEEERISYLGMRLSWESRVLCWLLPVCFVDVGVAI